MGSGAATARATAAALNARGDKVGVLQMRLYRPFPTDALLAALPTTVRGIAVLEQTKEPGSLGEPMYLDVVTALAQAGRLPRSIIGGRYGLSSKDFGPALAKSVFDELNAAKPRNGFTVGITDDVSHTSLLPDDSFQAEPPGVVSALFYGLGPDGTVGANKNSVKIIAEDAGLHAQGYFVYNSHKSGAQTVSHALWAAADRRAVPDPTGELHRHPSVPVRRAAGHAETGRAGRHRAAERAVRGRHAVGPPAARHAAGRHRPQAAPVRDRRVRRGRTRGPARPGKYRAADMLFRAVERAAAGSRDRAHQEGDQQDLCPPRRGGGGEQLRRGGRRAGPPRRSARAGNRHQQLGTPAGGASQRARVRARGHRADAGRPRRRNPGQPHPGGRHLAVRHLAPGRSATSPTASRPGTRTCASSAASAASSAHTA